MGNSHNQKISEDQLDDILPHENNKKKSILATCKYSIPILQSNYNYINLI